MHLICYHYEQGSLDWIAIQLWFGKLYVVMHLWRRKGRKYSCIAWNLETWNKMIWYVIQSSVKCNLKYLNCLIFSRLKPQAIVVRLYKICREMSFKETDAYSMGKRSTAAWLIINYSWSETLKWYHEKFVNVVNRRR